MNPTKNLAFRVVVIFVATSAIPVGLTAQDGRDHRHRPHHYQLVDMGTLGGPQSYIADVGVPGGRFVNNRGVLTGYSDTSTPDPFPSNCFNPDCFVAHAFRWQDGFMTDIGAERFDLSSASAWISENGLIAGFAENGEIDPVTTFPELHAALWQNGGITDLGALPGGYESVANSVNSRGQVVGASVNAIPDPNTLADLTFNFVFSTNQLRAIVWQDRVMQDLGTLGGPDSLALLNNERGQVMGWSYISATKAGVCFPLAIGSFIWEKEKGMRDLGSLGGGTCTLASDLNKRGQVVGYGVPAGDTFLRAFLWEDGSIRDLGGSLGGSSTGAFVVNDAGHAAGFAAVAGDYFYHAALWKRIGQITDLGTIGSDPCSSAKAINAKGQVVGDSISLSNCQTNGDASRAFLWEDGVIFDLNALIPAGSPLHLIHPQNINDRGEIAGLGVDASGHQHAFLLIPCDEVHPGREGCDYSLVGPIPAVEAAPAESAHPSGGRNTQSGFRDRLHDLMRGRNPKPVVLRTGQ